MKADDECHECIHTKPVSLEACQRIQGIMQSIHALMDKMPLPESGPSMEAAHHLGQLNFLEDTLFVAFTRNQPYIELKVPLVPCIAKVLCEEGFNIRSFCIGCVLSGVYALH